MQNKKLAELLHQYFELGVAEGREGRNHDTKDGDAQRVLSEIEAEIAALSEAETDARSPFTIVAEWHDQQARRFKEMSRDDRSGELGKAKAAAAAKHHAGSAAAMRLQAINERQGALLAKDE